jgi:hypothetical protein
MGHIGIIMDENNSKVQDEEVINCKCSHGIVARIIKGEK